MGPLFNRIIPIDGYNRNAYAYRGFIAYFNDIINGIASSQQSPASFDPEVGLARRTNFQENFILIVYNPRPKKYFNWIRQFQIYTNTIDLCAV